MTSTNEHHPVQDLGRSLWRPALRAALVGLAIVPINNGISDVVFRIVDPDNDCELECLLYVPLIFAIVIVVVWGLLRFMRVPLASLVTALTVPTMWLTYLNGKVVMACLLLAVNAAVASTIVGLLRELFRRRRSARQRP